MVYDKRAAALESAKSRAALAQGKHHDGCSDSDIIRRGSNVPRANHTHIVGRIDRVTGKNRCSRTNNERLHRLSARFEIPLDLNGACDIIRLTC